MFFAATSISYTVSNLPPLVDDASIDAKVNSVDEDDEGTSQTLNTTYEEDSNVWFGCNCGHGRAMGASSEKAPSGFSK